MRCDVIDRLILKRVSETVLQGSVEIFIFWTNLNDCHLPIPEQYVGIDEVARMADLPDIRDLDVKRKGL